MIPQTSPGGIRYLACADYDIDYVKGLLQKNALRSITTIFFFLFLSVLIIIIYSKLRSEYFEALKKSEMKFRSFFEHTPDYILVLEPNNENELIITDFNDAACKKHGYLREELLGKPITFLNNNPLPPAEKQIDRLMAGETITFEIIHKKKDNSTFPAEATTKFFEIDGRPNIISIERDITDRKLAEDAQQRSEKQLRAIINIVPAMIFVKNGEGRFLAVNKTVADSLDMEINEVVGRLHAELHPDPEEVRHMLKDDLHVIESGKPVTISAESYLDNTGATRWLHTIKAPVPENIFGERAIVGYAMDITNLKQAEEEKKKAQKITADQEKMALVGQIAGKMAHDFNNILGIVMGNTELALLDCEDSQIRKTLELIFEQTLRGKNLTKNLIAFAKDQEPKQEFFKVSEKVELVLNLLKKDLEGIDAIKEEGHGVPDLLADPGMIEHALVNLVQNSIHATSMVEQPQIIIRTFHQDKNIYIEIKDNGCGIPEEALGRIYEPAFTMKGSRDITNSYKLGIKGTGYGMANVKRYIEQHKGNILIDSKVGVGTKFIICIPVIKKELTKKEIIEIQKKKFYFEKYILVVEDEQAISDVQYKILTHEPCNHKVDIAANAQMAIDLFDRNKYDFVSLDYVLPGELSGMDVYKHIRQTNKTLPILFVSGNLDFLESIRELKNQDPYIDHVSKPCQNKDFINSINQLLENTL